MRAKTHGLAQSVHTRLVQHARSLGVDVNLVLTRFATERLLYRLSRSPQAERFVLKGALLMLVWLGETIRPTRDADLLGFGDLSDEALVEIFRDVCAVEVEPDAMTSLKDSMRFPKRVDCRGIRQAVSKARTSADWPLGSEPC